MEQAATWAKHGGLIGLIIFSLFGVILLILHWQAKKETTHADLIANIIEKDREERRLDRAEHKLDREEHKQTFSKLSDAIDRLASELRN